MQSVRVVLRGAILLDLAAATVALMALSGEYPGDTAAGRRVASREVLPLTLLAWPHLGALDAAPGSRSARVWAAAAAAGDLALLVWSVPGARSGGAPIALALPWIAALLLAGVGGLTWQERRRGERSRAVS